MPNPLFSGGLPPYFDGFMRIIKPSNAMLRAFVTPI
jgi:hypothetical protein